MSFSMSRDDILLLVVRVIPTRFHNFKQQAILGATQRAILPDCKTSVGSGFERTERGLDQRYQKYDDRRENQNNPDQGREAVHGSIKGNSPRVRLVPALIPALPFHFDHSEASPRTRKTANARKSLRTLMARYFAPKEPGTPTKVIVGGAAERYTN